MTNRLSGVRDSVHARKHTKRAARPCDPRHTIATKRILKTQGKPCLPCEHCTENTRKERRVHAIQDTPSQLRRRHLRNIGKSWKSTISHHCSMKTHGFSQVPKVPPPTMCAGLGKASPGGAHQLAPQLRRRLRRRLRGRQFRAHVRKLALHLARQRILR